VTRRPANEGAAPFRTSPSSLPWWSILLFAAAGLLITVLWTIWAGTEIARYYRSDHSFNSIVELVDGSAPAPFVYRRLYPDVTKLLAGSVPAPVWESIERYMTTQPFVRTIVVTHFKWLIPSEYPVLVSGTVLIWLSAMGFMIVAQRLIASQYDVSRTVSIVCALLLGLALLGGGGSGGVDHPYKWYPYDFTTAFVFALAIYTLVKRSLWFIPGFLVACYSKESAILLLPAYWLLRPHGVRRTLVTIAILAAAFVAIRLDTQNRYIAGGLQFWWPGRNLQKIGGVVVFDSWMALLLVLGIVYVLSLRRKWPADLRRLSLLVPLMLIPAFFKGWIEERRQYLELLIIVGPLVLQALDTAIGMRLMRAREPGPSQVPAEARPARASTAS
jgi:hypothetical protein